MRAGQIAPRGMAKLAMGAIESYRGTDKIIDEVIKRKADIMKIVESYTGDGNFKIKLDKNPTTMRLDVRATGKTLSEVLPAGALVPMAAVLTFGMRKSSKMGTSMPAPMPKPITPAPQPRPAPRTVPAPQPTPAPKTAPAPAPRQ
jgi:hypothetical protein